MPGDLVPTDDSEPTSASVPLLVRAGDLEIDVTRLRVRLRGRTLHLEGLQLRLLIYFAQCPDRVLTRDQILTHVWTTEPGKRHPKVVDVLVCRLRKRLAENGGRIKSVRGFGYRFDVEP